ncbi:hypothetical protein J421_2291 [Gemmatirosa kalamazoonensis]|uniref:Uncharacterized protein n=1 Tax=Gemmatirosa kalamazoonensis TaxID=861299 RepID=W0RK75_9BACT|nr:hypothetical protein [Gemmatirosa kalamazoonensis]AHG89828.1 hypothetical protein J421_2291 [Gemmatirosa kalamazoonensis]
MRDTPALRVRDPRNHERLERGIAGALGVCAGTGADDLRIRLDSTRIGGLLRLGGAGWVAAANAEASVGEYVRQVLGALDASLLPPPHPG